MFTKPLLEERKSLGIIPKPFEIIYFLIAFLKLCIKVALINCLILIDVLAFITCSSFLPTDTKILCMLIMTTHFSDCRCTFISFSSLLFSYIFHFIPPVTVISLYLFSYMMKTPDSSSMGN